MAEAGPVAVSGAGGRLGRAVVGELARRGTSVAAWSRPDFDLDDPASAALSIERDGPRLVVHCAAWTDVDGCARDPELAERRNAAAVGELAAACAAAGVGLVVISSNEVFDGRRDDGRGYVEEDPVGPINPYGASKLHGERAAADAFAAAGKSNRLWIVRTSWLFGPPGNDFPVKILAAADRLQTGQPLTVVAEERATPTYTLDLAVALLDLVAAAPGGVYHLAAPGAASRYEVALEIVRACRPNTDVQPIGRDAFIRASTPPAFSALDSSRAAGYGAQMRPWRDALLDYLSGLC